LRSIWNFFKCSLWSYLMGSLTNLRNSDYLLSKIAF
jgi:hypothetical protein